MCAVQLVLAWTACPPRPRPSHSGERGRHALRRGRRRGRRRRRPACAAAASGTRRASSGSAQMAAARRRRVRLRHCCCGDSCSSGQGAAAAPDPGRDYRKWAASRQRRGLLVALVDAAASAGRRCSCRLAAPAACWARWTARAGRRAASACPAAGPAAAASAARAARRRSARTSATSRAAPGAARRRPRRRAAGSRAVAVTGCVRHHRLDRGLGPGGDLEHQILALVAQREAHAVGARLAPRSCR